jgi:hypothetical protein
MVPSQSMLAPVKVQEVALQVEVKPAVGATFAGTGPPPPNFTLSGFEQVIVPASHTLNM